MAVKGKSVSLEDVDFGYGETRVHFDLSIDAGSFVAVTGPSGSGKTTMLNLIAGFEFAETGIIRIGGQDISRQPVSQRPVSFLFQENNLFSHLSVSDNVALGISPALKLSPIQRNSVMECLDRVGMSDKLERLPAQLSGGERQRAALARVLVQDNQLLLMDEPFASLGPGLRLEMSELVAQLQAENGMTLMLVTHHPDEIASIAPQLCFIEAGRVAAFGPTKELLSSRGPVSVRQYLGADGQIR
jgi:thiamine transport system ATP-binding protein